jgi:hypothetical protein
VEDQKPPHRARRPRVCDSRPQGQHAPQTEDNVGRRLKVAIKDANEALDSLGIERISERVSPHDLRRSYGPLRLAAGDDPFRVSEQLGHATPKITFSVYHRAVKRRAKLSGVYAEQFDRALQWAEIGRIESGEVVNLADARISKVIEPAPRSQKLNVPGA